MSFFPNPKRGTPSLVLAPMEGVTDAPMRALMSERGGFTYCVSEFLRVSQDIPPQKTFFEHVPELRTGARTASGLPVQIQILGGDPERMAGAASEAVRAGAQAVDLNFGCPAPTVNRHDGGATLLKYPERMETIVRTVREALPRAIPVSAKLRLGWDTVEAIHRNADAAALGGADWITIHARTRMQAYQPPVYWKPIGEVRARLGIPVIANGDIWSFEDFQRCREITGSEHFMLGRCALSDPHLPLRVARELGIRAPSCPERPLGVFEWAPLVERFAELSAHFADPRARNRNYALNRTKQWLKMVWLNRGAAQASWFDEVKKAESLDEILSVLRVSRDTVALSHGQKEFAHVLSNCSA
jgi:tRNA-dihydrouridine synthase C